MGDSLRVWHPNDNMGPRLIASRNPPNRSLLASTSAGLTQSTLKHITSMRKGIPGSGAIGEIALFLLKTAVLHVVQRFSMANCPLAWHGLQALQLLCYPPLKWIQRWAPFKGLVDFMQTLSRPLIVLSVATVFSDHSGSAKKALGSSNDSQTYAESPSDVSDQLSISETRSSGEVPKNLASEKWLLQLHEELEKQGITLPERLNEDELRRFYAAANGEFKKFLSSVKKTIRWRQAYTIFSPQEFEAWSDWVFWHGYDVKQRHCLIIRLGLACSNLRSNEKPLFAKAVVSQIEHGVMHLVDAANPQITVLMDCEGISPFGFPMQMMRSCAILLQDHYPNRLCCLIVVRLPPVARVITRTLFQVLRPATQQKLRIVGDNYQKFLSEFLQAFPPFLGGKCSCPKCLQLVDIQDMNEETIRIRPSANLSTDPSVSAPEIYCHSDTGLNESRDEVVKTAIIGFLMIWIFIAVVLATQYPGSLSFLHWQGGA